MSINSNGQHTGGLLTDRLGSRDPRPGPVESHAGSQPIARTPAPEQILFIASSADTLARVAMPPLHEDPLDPHYQMLTRPEILVRVDHLMKAFGTLWGPRDFHLVGWPAEVRENLLYIYDRFSLMVERFDSRYEAYGRPDLAATYIYTLATPLPTRSADKDKRSESVKCFEAYRELCRMNGLTDHAHAHECALKSSYTGDAAALIFSAFENEEVLQEIHATAHALMNVVWEECSPAWHGSVAFLDEPSQPATVHRPELGPREAGRAAPGDGITATNGRDIEAPAHQNGIDYDALADSLLRSKHALASKLVKFMKDRSTATFQEVMDEVHGGERTSEAIRSLINRTNNHLHELNSRLTFSTNAEHVIRHEAPE